MHAGWSVTPHPLFPGEQRSPLSRDGNRGVRLPGCLQVLCRGVDPMKRCEAIRQGLSLMLEPSSGVRVRVWTLRRVELPSLAEERKIKPADTKCEALQVPVEENES